MYLIWEWKYHKITLILTDIWRIKGYGIVVLDYRAERESYQKAWGYELHRSHNQWGKKSKGIRDGRRKCFLSRRPPTSDFRLTKDRRMQCNKFTLISHKFKLCIFFAYWKDNSLVPGQHPRTFACKWDGKWCWGWSWDGAGELGARSYTLVHLSEPRYPRVGDAKHHLTPVAPCGSYFWPG